MDEIDRRWKALCQSNPAYFDGRAYNVLGVSRNGGGGAAIHVIECAYRFYAVQDANFGLGVWGLGVKAFTMCGNRTLLGRRSRNVAVYPDLWEFAPGGVVEPGKSPAEVIVSELREETGLLCARDPTPIAIVSDLIARTWEIVSIISDPLGEAKPSVEYSELRWCTRIELPTELSPIAQSMLALWPQPA